MNSQQRKSERAHIMEQLEFYTEYTKTLQKYDAPPDMIEACKEIIADFRKRLRKLREG